MLMISVRNPPMKEADVCWRIKLFRVSTQCEVNYRWSGVKKDGQILVVV